MRFFKILAPFLAAVLVITTLPVYTAVARIDTPRTVVKQTTEDRVEEILKGMSTDEKIAQMLLVEIPSEEATKKQKKYQFGGYVLFAGSFRNSTKDKKKKQLKGYQKASKINMLLAVDEEGGTVNRVSCFKQFRKTPFKSPRNVYKSGGWDGIKKDTKSKDKLLKSIGLNTNLAPVADVAYNSNNFIYSRSFSTSAKSTSKFVKLTVNQMKSDNVVSTLKHFPGYGNNGDTHSNIIRDKRKLSTFESRDLKPFQTGIDNGCDMIMVSHNIVNAFDKKNPASLSKNVHKYLRNKMGFDGVIVTDGLGMAGVVDFVGGDYGEVAIRSIIAGNDMLCIPYHADTISKIKKAVKSGRISQKQIDDSVRRILKMKIKRGIIK